MNNAGVLLGLIPLLLIIQAIFSGSEIALLSADRLKLKEPSDPAQNRDRGRRQALELASNPERILSTTLLVSNLCMIAISATVTLYFRKFSTDTAELYTVLITSPLVVLFGELIPKTLFHRNRDRLAPWASYPIYWVYWGLYPVTKLISSYTQRLSKFVGPMEQLIAGKRKSTREELGSLLRYSRSETTIKNTERKMIRRILDFKDAHAKQVMIPLVRVEAIERSATVQEALEAFERHRHSRMPVYQDRVDNIVGLLSAESLIVVNELKQPLRHFCSEVRYVAATHSLFNLLTEMRSEGDEFVVVVDEHGGAIGILTYEDVVEEIFGDIRDEFDADEQSYKKLSDLSWVIQAKMEISQINESLKLELPEGDYETLGGFLLQQFGRIPEPRDELFLDTPAGSIKFSVRKATERRVESVLVELTPTEKA